MIDVFSRIGPTEFLICLVLSCLTLVGILGGFLLNGGQPFEKFTLRGFVHGVGVAVALVIMLAIGFGLPILFVMAVRGLLQ